MKSLHVKGMSCGHCRKAVLDAVQQVSGVTGAEVDLSTGILSWKDAGADVEAVKKAIRQIGFEVED